MSQFVKCPFDPTHVMLENRLPIHLIKCTRSNSQVEMLRCVFNTTHLIKAQEFQSHLLSCESRPDFDRFVIADALPAELTAADQIDIIQCKEDWDAEPVVESYKPESHITNKLIMRRLTGGSASVRREFRESERKRFQNITEVNQDESM